MEIDFNMVAPCLKDKKIDKDKLFCVFQVEEKTFEVEETIEHLGPNIKIGKKIVRTSGVGFMKNLLHTIFRSGKIKSNDQNYFFNDAEIENAVLSAFEKILPEVVFDKSSRNWKVNRGISAFEKKVKEHPIQLKSDKSILARMIVEMAKVDGGIFESERLFFEEFLTIGTTKLAEFIRAPYITKEDLYVLSKDKSEVVFLIVAATALVDFNYHDAEAERLSKFGKLLNLSPDDQQQLFEDAQDYILQIHFQANIDRLDKEELRSVAEQLNMSEQQMLRTYNRVKQQKEPS